MNLQELQKIKELCESASKGPWKLKYDEAEASFSIVDSTGVYLMDFSLSQRDGEFCVKARELLPKLLNEVERLTNLLWELTKISDFASHDGSLLDYVKGLKERVRELERSCIDSQFREHALNKELSIAKETLEKING
jgi:hypothetical protein